MQVVKQTPFGPCDRCGATVAVGCACCKKSVVHCANCVRVGEGGFMKCGAWRDEFLCDDCVGKHYPLPHLEAPVDCQRCWRSISDMSEGGSYWTQEPWDGKFLCGDCIRSITGRSR
jgi:hypothetical protein